MTLPDSAKELIRSGALGHLVTLDPDGTAQVTCVARRDALAKLERPWFSGGTIVAAFVQRQYY
jgi:hypothetical protein